MSYEALIAAQAKRLTNKRERLMDWRDEWRSDCRTYADLYPPKYQVLERGEYTPHPAVRPGAALDQIADELSHTEWADGYHNWRAKIDADPEWFKAQCAEMKRRLFGAPCFAENEI
jgi:hypothetical protein